MLESQNLIQLLETADGFLRASRMETGQLQAAKPCLQELARRLNLSYEEALVVACLFNLSNYGNIDMDDLCRYFNCRPLQVLSMRTALDSLCDKGFLCVSRRTRGDDFRCYSIPEKIVSAIQHNRLPEPKNYAGLTADEWIDELEEIFTEARDSELSSSRIADTVHQLIDSNPQLRLVQYIKQFDLSDNDLLLVLMTMSLFVRDSDDCIVSSDVDDIFGPNDLNRMLRSIRRGNHSLIKMNLIEPANQDGQADTRAWKLTDKAKKEWLCELDINLTADIRTGLQMPDTIAEKSLFFSPAVSKQIDQLRMVLMPEHFAKVQSRLEQHHMRRGFTCIFYGSPGTGKTETVYQLARATGRAIMQVDIPNMRSKWVGDTEKNIKATFDRYRDYCAKMSLAPILLFNEADAILGKRSENTERSVDKMENAMQNIILQEMETIDGIMIATTNLTNNLDAAFERRFLYKIEFPKPTPQESRHIWHAMLPELPDNEALALATQYCFSGGQIENIARKQMINRILCDKDGVDIAAIQEACNNELLHKRQTKAIGFC